MGTRLRRSIVAVGLCGACVTLWATPYLTANRLSLTAAVALAAGVAVVPMRVLGLAIVVAFATSVGVWLSWSHLPVYVVVGSMGRFAVVAAVAVMAARACWSCARRTALVLRG